MCVFRCDLKSVADRPLPLVLDPPFVDRQPDGYTNAAALMMHNGGGGTKRRAEDAFSGGNRAEGGSQGSGEDDAQSKMSSASKSTAYSGSAGAGAGGGGGGGARPRKTPQRQQGQGHGQAETPGGGGGTPSVGGGADKSMKGLRHFSLKVCKKVEEKGRTNYNEVGQLTSVRPSVRAHVYVSVDAAGCVKHPY